MREKVLIGVRVCRTAVVFLVSVSGPDSGLGTFRVDEMMFVTDLPLFVFSGVILSLSPIRPHRSSAT